MTGLTTPADDRELTIDGTRVADDTPCYVIAEIGHNHQGSVEQCCTMIDVAARAGVDAVKLQKRDNPRLFTQAQLSQPYENENSYGPTFGEHRAALEFDVDAYRTVIAHARECGVTLFATAFDAASADLLAGLDLPAYKIASGDLTNIPLIEHVARIGRPVIISTGGADLEDVTRAHAAASAITDQVAILQCTAGYPAAWGELDLRVIETYRDTFPGSVVGFSSHDNGIAMATAAVALGARIVEKHFTLDRTMKGTDHSFSLEPQGITKLVRDLRRLHDALGDGTKRRYESEAAPIRKMGKAIYTARALPEGHVLTAEDLATRSPADGLPPYRLADVIGRPLAHAVEAEHAIATSDLRG